MNHRISARGTGQFLRRKLQAFAREEQEKARRAMQGSVLIVEREIAPLMSVDRGRMRNALSTRVLVTASRIIGRIQIANLIYAPVQERGRRPGTFPPLAPLEAWVRRKGIARGKGARRVAFLIARKQMRQGMPGRHFFRDGTRKALPRVRRRFRVALSVTTRGQ
jgi:hypothetical protein